MAPFPHLPKEKNRQQDHTGHIGGSARDDQLQSRWGSELTSISVVALNQ